ncbi:MAG: hypothetical protein M3R52_06770, partial [Acidobacteriota bacterium]|nr:hypothetical protein [Acidobacteriota bacterium]
MKSDVYDEPGMVAAERARIQAEYARRDSDATRDLYAPWQPAPIFMHTGRKRVAAMMLHRAGLIPFS